MKRTRQLPIADRAMRRPVPHRGHSAVRIALVALTAVWGLTGMTPSVAGPMSLGTTVWIDADWDGQHDAGEPVVPGVTVTLRGGPLPAEGIATVTDAQGRYLFADLDPASDYVVTIEPDQMAPGSALYEALAAYYATQVSLGIPTSVPAKALSTVDSPTSGADNQVDDDDNGAQPAGYGTLTYSPTIDLSDGDGNTTVDFGFVHACAVICDLDRDGQVTKADTDAIFQKSRNSAARIVEPGAPHSGDCGQTGVVTGNDSAWCKAFRQDLQPREVALGNLVWEERNGVSGFNPGDQPLAGIAVDLYDGDGNLIASDTTDGDGCYLFDGLDPVARSADGSGAFFVSIDATQPALGGLVPVAGAGDDETTDDDVDQNGFDYDGSVETNLYILVAGAQPTGEAGGACAGKASSLPDANVNLTADFAFAEPPPAKVAVGNLVWIDTDGELGFNPLADIPRAGVRVELMAEGAGPEDEPLEVVVTDGQGCYLFDGLDEGTYYLRIPASELTVGGTLDGYGPLPDPQGDGGPASAYGDDDATDDGALPPAAPDQNGRPEETATGLSGHVVSSLFTLTAGDEPTGEPGAMCNGSALPDASVNLTLDFAFEAKVAIGNLVWIDRDGVPGFDPAVDQPVDGVPVQLYEADTHRAVASTTTRSGGFYLFDELSPGRYYLLVPPEAFSEAGPGPLFGFVSVFADGIDETDPELNGVASPVFELRAGSEPTFETGAASAEIGLASRLPDENVNLTADFAFEPAPAGGAGLMSLGSTIWIDADWNGIHDNGEPTVPGVTVTLKGGLLPAEGIAAVTDAQGNYLFTNLDPANDYRVSIEADQMASGSPLYQALASYYATEVALGIPSSVPTKPLSTVDTLTSGTDNQVDGDDNGAQPAGYGTRVYSPQIRLSLGDEPLSSRDPDGVPTPGLEYRQVGGSDGFAQDDASDESDSNGDMTLDFGFIHACAVICDVDRDGRVTKADTDAIFQKSRNRSARIVEPGAPHSGDCGQTGVVTGNDSAWCKAFRQDL